MSNIVPFQEMEGMASYIVRSKLFGAKDESQAMALMMLAQAEGMHPMSAIQDFDIVQGRPARKTHSILARFQAAGGSVAWEVISATKAVGTFTHKQGGTLRVEWTFEQAKKAGLTNKDNWKNYPQAMLRARVIAEGVRAVYPGAIGGMLTVEEAQDLAPTQAMRDMGNADVVMSKDWVAAASMCQSTDELTKCWEAGIKEIKAANDMGMYTEFKSTVAARGAELKKPVISDDARTIDMSAATPAPEEPTLSDEELDLQRSGGQP
jgi:hypothetical protein